MIEKLGGNDPCPCRSGRRFRRCCRNSGRYGDTNGHYYVRD
ncbi:SEC-C metal-binding domain-containing protein [Krasilnikovia sp. M28-CT-15]